MIELMIVVGIIGILVAIAAPNFSRYQSKARQSEAKIALAAIYGAEKSFYSEYSAYMASFEAVGYSPEGAKRFYSVGWTAAPSGTANGYNGGTANHQWLRIGFPATWTTCSAVPSSATTGADAQTFTVEARGQIRDSMNCDTWTINHLKVISNTTVNL